MLKYPNSSISTVPPLSLSSFQKDDKNRQQASIKERISSSFTLTDMLKLPGIAEQKTQRLQVSNFLNKKDSSKISLDQIRTLKEIGICLIGDMTQEQCIIRYESDPFFRKKIQAELKSLKKYCSSAQMPRTNNPSDPYEIQSTIKLIQNEESTTYRKIKQNNTLECLQEKNSYQKLMNTTQIKERKFNKQNIFK